MAGVEMVGAIDMCPIATKNYKANFPNAKVYSQKLEEVNFVRLKQEIGQIDILFASPECTNHTCAKGSAPRDEKSRATAMFVVEYARQFNPRWIVMENVIHMRPWSRYGELKGALASLGYKIAEQVLDASDFGVPQSRRRLFVVCDKVREPSLVATVKRGRRPTVKSILDPEGTWESSLLYDSRRAKPTLERAERGFKALGKKQSFLLVYYGTDGSGGWQPLDRPLRTVTTVDRFALISPSEEGPKIRMLQVPELKRAMGFPDNYKMSAGTRRDHVRVLGNGVCPPVMKTVVRQLIA
jgi:DNA (cytosine-5)-methyltransferase 1